ncbi:hypothetical protein CDD81_2998 [Ophiocordyceps australis]|uniref:Uncharacterized protein n=1 Tax=Ophiocordyceps australis TaxID=1399860 RepID=A0A2C5XCF2_9HYPO|nr:hypothetical protein CDD81_2998 [Ophiocordyceps australis]
MDTQQPRVPMGGLSPQGSSKPLLEGPVHSTRPHTSEGRRSPLPPGPPRSPNLQQPKYRPDPSRPMPQQALGGALLPQGRGYPSQGPPGYGPASHAGYAPFPGAAPPPGGAYGRGGPPQNAGSFQRKPLPSKPHQSLTPNDIIEHYVYDTQKGTDTRRPLPPPGHQQRYGAGAQQGFYGGGSADGHREVDLLTMGLLQYFASQLLLRLMALILVMAKSLDLTLSTTGPPLLDYDHWNSMLVTQDRVQKVQLSAWRRGKQEALMGQCKANLLLLNSMHSRELLECRRGTMHRLQLLVLEALGDLDQERLVLSLP